jgi:hypothetical protein
MKRTSMLPAFAIAVLALAGAGHAQSDRIQASVSLATINDILEKFRATKGLDQSGYQNVGNVLPVTYSATINKFGLTLDAPNSRAILTADLNLAANFDFPGWTYKYNCALPYRPSPLPSSIASRREARFPARLASRWPMRSRRSSITRNAWTLRAWERCCLT